MDLEALLVIGGIFIVLGVIIILPLHFLLRRVGRRRLEANVAKAKLAAERLPPELRVATAPEVVDATIRRLMPDIETAIAKSVFARFNVSVSPIGGISVAPEAGVIQQLAENVFGQAAAPEVLKCLSQYGTGRYEKANRERVHLDILRLSNGDMAKIRELVKAAKSDFRDVMGKAETPNFSSYYFDNVKTKGAGGIQLDPTDPELRKATEADFRQFCLWLVEHGK